MSSGIHGVYSPTYSDELRLGSMRVARAPPGLPTTKVVLRWGSGGKEAMEAAELEAGQRASERQRHHGPPAGKTGHPLEDSCDCV